MSQKIAFLLCQLRQMWKFDEAQTEIKMQNGLFDDISCEMQYFLLCF